MFSSNSRRIPLPQKSSLYDEIRERGNRLIHLPYVSSMIKKTTPSNILQFLSNVDAYCESLVNRSWTENKDNKLLFLRQLGEWYVTDKCIGKPIADIIGIGSSSNMSALVLPCCATEPIFSCHYRDKPSKLPCKSSDTIDPGGGSFW